jgi:hypothetical protein
VLKDTACKGRVQAGEFPGLSKEPSPAEEKFHAEVAQEVEDEI